MIFQDPMTFKEQIYVEVSKEKRFITMTSKLVQQNVKIIHEA